MLVNPNFTNGEILFKDGVDSSLSSSSKRPVENNVITQALQGKSDVNHSHLIKDITNFPSYLEPLFKQNTWYPVGDDSYIGSHGVAGGLGIQGNNGITKLDFCKQDDPDIYKSISFDGTTLTVDGNCEYAKTAGNANTVGGLSPYHVATLDESGNSQGNSLQFYCKFNKFGDNRYGLGINSNTDYQVRVDFASNAESLSGITSGSEVKPVYFSNGKPVACDYLLNKTVPSDAVFTDTKVTSSSNHYTPVKSTTKSASGGTLTDIANSTLGTQVVTGVEMDAKGHVTGVVSTSLKTSVPVIVSLTRNEYDSLTTKDPNTYYMITDDIGDTTDAVVLNVGHDKEFTSFTSAMWVASTINDQKVIVNVFAGEYDVYSELGGDNYIEGIGSSKWRDIHPLLSGNVEIKGIGNVVLKLEIPDNIYTNYKLSCEQVSTIGTERNILVENITFVNKNCRYSIHDECGNNEEAANTKHIFRNCRFYNNNTISCIGVGTVTGYFEVENCYTENTTTGSFFLHDWVKSTGGNLIIKNCVFNSESGIDVILSVNSNPESVFDVYLANNVFEKLAITSSDINQFNTNIFRVIGVHNTITTTAVKTTMTNPYPIKLY